MSFNPEQRTQLSKPVKGVYSGLSQKLVVDLVFAKDSPWTDQSQKDDADINIIMARYQATGEVPYLNENMPQWMDTTGVDFQRAMDVIIEAQTAFDDLPSSVRERFGNDPAAFLEFTSKEENAVEIAKMGLLTPEATELILYPTPAPSTSEPKTTPEA